jgi:hypothetical protein
LTEIQQSLDQRFGSRGSRRCRIHRHLS